MVTEKKRTGKKHIGKKRTGKKAHMYVIECQQERN